MKLDGISSAQLESAVKTSRLINAAGKTERDQAIVQAIRRSQRALSRELTEAFKPSVTRYSLEYLNTSGRFTPQQILRSFRRRPKGSVLLYGPPGTGKTQSLDDETYLTVPFEAPTECATALNRIREPRQMR
jgi:SpoVK/Ycf46/Vps4 family AAA+-type ATPase